MQLFFCRAFTGRMTGLGREMIQLSNCGSVRMVVFVYPILSPVLRCAMEDSLEQRLAVKFCEKLDKNLTDTSAMTNTQLLSILEFRVGLRRLRRDVKGYPMNLNLEDICHSKLRKMWAVCKIC